MAQTVTLGGERIGSGNKQTVSMHDYAMTSFNLEQDFKSTMAPGVLYPFLKAVATNHGTFDIDLDSFCRTLPTKGPLFGSFKLQLDIYAAPIRLYQGLLHNNPVTLGMKMNQVYLPKLLYKTADGKDAPTIEGSSEDLSQVSENALLKYMGISGAGKLANQQVAGTVQRKFNAVPILAYYDIFKNYYANKQEENAYVITPGNVTPLGLYITNSFYRYSNAANPQNTVYVGQVETDTTSEEKGIPGIKEIGDYNAYSPHDLILYFEFNMKWDETVSKKNEILGGITINFYLQTEEDGIVDGNYSLDGLITEFGATPIWNELEGKTTLSIQISKDQLWEITQNIAEGYVEGSGIGLSTYMDVIETTVYTNSINLTPFKLENIDDMRNALLSNNTIGSEFIVGDGGNWDEDSGSDSTGLPYSTLFARTDEGISWNAFQMNGLCVKTYQSDLFNNWLDSEYIDGENGISAISSVAVIGNKFTMDSLNLAEKIYEYLNRVLVSGGTYEDWQEATYGQGAIRKAETPMYLGGMSAEIMFEEVIANTAEGENQKLGSLGGKGTQVGKKGGNNIHVKCDEPSYIIGIVSITPRICYSQGNDWDMTELDTMDDLHKPALDGIGFQDLIVEQMAWWNTIMSNNSTDIIHRSSAGKQTAWINYQTAVDKCFGDFAKTQDGYAFMVLNRNYEHGDLTGSVKDITTYIDPAKYNYAFAYSKLDAQNFWLQIHSKVIARRKMAGRQIPNV